MAVVLESSSLRRYYGLSTDAKPVTEATEDTIPNGSVFTETDTGREYTWDGTAWTYATAATSAAAAQSEQLELLGDIVNELRAIRDRLDLIIQS